MRLPARAVLGVIPGCRRRADRGLREQWLPLFDRYEVDLVLCGHGRGYERSFPIRGFDSAAALRPHPVTTIDSGVFDTSQGTVYLVLGGGGEAGGGQRGGEAGGGEGGGGEGGGEAGGGKGGGGEGGGEAGGGKGGGGEGGGEAGGGKGGGGEGGGEAGGGKGGGGEGGGEAGGGGRAAAWSARRDSATGYGVAVFDVNPGAEAGAQTAITVSYYHAVDAGLGADPGDGEADDYALFDTVTLVRPRSDGRRWHPKEPVASNLA